MGGACSAYGDRRGVFRVLVGKHERERGHFGEPGVVGRIILRWICRKWDEGAWTGLIWLRIGTGKRPNEPSGSIKCREFLD